jgi:hypothetical protein
MRNIQENEQVVLFKQKVRQGKNEQQASAEVERDVDYINNLKKKINEKKKETTKLRLERQKVDDNFKKEFEKLVKSKEKLSKPISTKLSHANTYHLTRILFCLEENKEMNVTKLGDYCCMCRSHVRDGLNFLLKHGLIKEIKKVGMSVYCLKENG